MRDCKCKWENMQKHIVHCSVFICPDVKANVNPNAKANANANAHANVHANANANAHANVNANMNTSANTNVNVTSGSLHGPFGANSNTNVIE